MRCVALAIVGAGPAGIAAAVEATRLGVRPLLFDATGRAGGTIRVAHEVRDVPFVEDRATGESVAERLEQYLLRWDVAIERARVIEIHATKEGVGLTTSNGPCCANAAVLATGTEPLFPAVPGLEFGSSRLMGDAPEACRNETPRRAAIIGGSDVAIDQARWLRKRGVEVMVLARGALRAPFWLTDTASREHVVIRTHSKVVSAAQRARGVELVVVEKNRETRETVDVVVAAVGRRPVAIAGARSAMDAQPERIRVAGDGTGRQARHVVAALGDGCVAAAELLARWAGGSK